MRPYPVWQPAGVAGIEPVADAAKMAVTRDVPLGGEGAAVHTAALATADPCGRGRTSHREGAATHAPGVTHRHASEVSAAQTSEVSSPESSAEVAAP
jgi:hypothetical protein